MIIRAFSISALISTIKKRPRLLASIVVGLLSVAAIFVDWQWPQGTQWPVDWNAGNMLYKQLIYMTSAECAGLVLGMKVPIILTSRSDSITSRIASCALAVLMVHRDAGRRASI